ncbi:hypothetical protein NVP1193O_079 [Vibrio phage 1.193.O._10N.286.52.C6]|nr:hypothetical protein NVP1193O_079 [Vibrio phage 1.193.O._10N.286.52.C6]
MNLVWSKFYQELDEYLYIVSNFEVSEYTLIVDRSIYDTVIFICENHHKALDELSQFCRNLYGSGEIQYHKMRVTIDGVRFIFSNKRTAMGGSLRGYDKRKTVIINRGGL